MSEREVGQKNPDDCQLNSGPFFQCCCNCQHHWLDNHHCTTAPDLRAKKGGCVCSEPKGWICTGMRETQPGCETVGVHSGWPEHSIGCEMYTPIKVIRRPRWAACMSESDHCRKNNADVRGCCSHGYD